MSNQLALLQKDITDTINHKLVELQNEGLKVPPSYNHSNALKSAFFKINNIVDKDGVPATQSCAPDTIANSLLEMVTQGLNPAKNQCYFIARKGKLTMQRSYFGTQSVIKSLTEVEDIWANVIYAGDDFEYEVHRGRERLVHHKTSFLNRDNEILGAYAVVLTTKGEEILTVMTKNEIQEAWNMSDSIKWKKGDAKTVHDKFPQEMAKKTVINRAAKSFINTSDDSELFIESVNRTTEAEYEPQIRDMGEIQEVQQEIRQNANTEVLDFDTGEIKQAPQNEQVVILDDEAGF